MEPRISILIANYNSSDMAINCIKSILDKQNMASVEIIVYDDGSTYEEQQKLHKSKKDFQKNYPDEILDNITLITDSENNGLGYAMNKLHERVRSKFIIKIDSDTLIIHKNFFDKLAKFLEEDKDLGLVTCKTDNIGQPLQWIKIPDVFETDEEIEEFMGNSDRKELSYHNKKEEAYSGMMFMYRREDIEKFNIEYCTKTKFLVEDNIFYLDVLRKMKKECAVANKLFIKHMTNNSKVENIPARELAKEIWEKEVL